MFQIYYVLISNKQMIFFSNASKSLEMYCAVGTNLIGRANNHFENVMKESIKLIYF